MKILSKASQYVIRVLMGALETDSLDGFSPKDICHDVDIPEPFVRKVLGDLVKAGIIKGRPGPGGGYRLVRPSGDVSLLDVVLAVDGPGAFDECPMGVRCEAMLSGGGFRACEDCTLPAPNCGMSHICPMHDMWKEVRKIVLRRLETTTLEDMHVRLVEATTTGSGAVPKPVAR